MPRRPISAGEGREVVSVFLNCPFDVSYRPILDAIVFAVFDAGFLPRCALEYDDGTEIRLSKILRIISQCTHGIHDISYTNLDPATGLPRFNMPFELGIFMGCKAFGKNPHQAKVGLVLDQEPFRYQKFSLTYPGRISERTRTTRAWRSGRSENGSELSPAARTFLGLTTFGKGIVGFGEHSRRSADSGRFAQKI